MKTVLAVAIALWVGAGVGAVVDNYSGDWWAVFLTVGVVLFGVTALYLRRPYRT